MSDSQKESLFAFVSSIHGGDGLRVEETLGDGFVRLRISEAERRQAKQDIRCVEDAVVELLRNARDAGAAHVFVGTSRDKTIRDVLVCDDGSGIPVAQHERVFEARVTSKLDSMRTDRWGVHGRGMALFSIRENALDARVVESNVGAGTCVRATFDVDAITERADQSTWPSMAKEQGIPVLRGPHNIIRACVEFGMEHQDQCKVYVGSPSEIIATMRARMMPYALSAGSSTSSEDRTVPVVCRPCLANDARELRSVAAALGVEMSERTAYRILRREIKPLRNVCVVVSPNKTTVANSSPSYDGLRRSISLAPADREELAETLAEDVNAFVKRYYLSLSAQPRIRVAGNRITVTFDVDELD